MSNLIPSQGTNIVSRREDRAVARHLGVKFEGLDCEGWLLYMGAEGVGMDPGRKITIPEPVSQTAEAVPIVLPDMCCVYNECASKVVA